MKQAQQQPTDLPIDDERAIMTDLHVLLYESLMETDASHNQFERRAALATRMPEAVPAGMEHGGERWQLTPNDKDCFQMFAFTLINEQAELLFIGNAVKVLVANAIIVEVYYTHEDGRTSLRLRGQGIYGGDVIEVDQPTLPAALAAALHRLCDERGAAKDTT